MCDDTRTLRRIASIYEAVVDLQGAARKRLSRTRVPATASCGGKSHHCFTTTRRSSSITPCGLPPHCSTGGPDLHPGATVASRQTMRPLQLAEARTHADEIAGALAHAYRHGIGGPECCRRPLSSQAP
jgi:hypothetical protein